MIHCVLHDPKDSVAVVVMEGIKAGQKLTALIATSSSAAALCKICLHFFPRAGVSNADHIATWVSRRIT